MKKRASLVAALGVFSISVSAQAGDLFKFEPAESDFYIAGFGGVSLSSDATFTGVSDPVAGVPGATGVAGTPLNVDVDYDTGFTFGGAIGYQLPFTYWNIFHPRLEVEVSYIDNDVSVGAFNAGTQTFEGDQSTVLVYLNNYSDIKFSEDQRFVPYIGGGLGAAFLDANIGYFPATATAPVFALEGNETAFVTHGALGATYKLSDNLDLYSEGRYYRVYGANFDRNFIGGGGSLFSGDVDDDLTGFTFTTGVRLRF